jgi:hypothetical protein
MEGRSFGAMPTDRGMLRTNHDLAQGTQGGHRRLQHPFTDDASDEDCVPLCEVIRDYES